MAIADELIALLGYKIEGENVARKYEATLNRIGGTIGRVAKTAGMLAGVLSAAAATGMSLLGLSTIKTSAQFERFETILTTIEGSAEKARQSLDWISDFAKTTPYEVAEITDAFVKLKAYGIDPVADDALRTLGDTASAMGKTLNQAVEAFADAATGEFERLKEFGIKAQTKGEQVTFNWTKNGEALSKTVKKNSEEIRAFLLETFGEKFTGAMDAQSRTWNGMLSNLGDTWTAFQRKIGDAGFFDKVKEQLQGILDYLNLLADNGTLDRWAKNFSDILSAMVDVIGVALNRLKTHFTFISEWLGSLDSTQVKVLAGAMAILFAIAFPVTAALVAAAVAIDDFLTYLEGGESIIGSFVEWIKRLPETLSTMGSAFSEWLSTIDWAALGQQAGRALAQALVEGIKAVLWGLSLWYEFLGKAAQALINFDWSVIGQAWVNALRFQLNLLVALFDEIAVQIIAAINAWFNIDLVATGQQWGRDLLSGLQAMGGAIRDWFTSLMPDWLKSFFAEKQKSANAAAAGAAVGAMAGQPSTITKDAANQNVGTNFDQMLKNFEAYAAKVGQAPEQTLNDNRQDNRQFPINAPVNVEVNVAQPAQAPAAVGKAVGNAAAGAVAAQRSQIEQEPAF